MTIDTSETDQRLLPLERKVLRTIGRFDMLEPGDRVLVGVSGGADSTALLACLHSLGSLLHLSLLVAHLNHQLRGEEADEDERFVGALCTDLGLSLLTEKTDVRGLAARRKLNLEDAARRARYDFLRRTAKKLDCRKIAVGHNLNDQAESVLIRFLRGSGPDGLSGIHPVLENLVIRPLLECSRAEIKAYLHSRGRSHREDSSNMELKLRRNRVRHELIPYLELHFNPRLLEALARSATRARDIAQYLDLEAGVALEGIRRAAGPDSVILSVKGLAGLPAVIRSGVIRRAIRECRGSLAGISDLHVREVVRLAASRHSGHSIDLPGRLAASLQFDELILGQTRAGSRPGFCYRLPIPGSCVVPETRLEFLARRGPWPEARPDRSTHAVLDADKLPPDLVVRSRKAGDRYGGPGHRKVKGMLINARIPLSMRGLQPMVVAGDAVIWVPGFLPAGPFRARAGSGRCIILEARVHSSDQSNRQEPGGSTGTRVKMCRRQE